MRKARDNPNDYWDKKLLEVEERGKVFLNFFFLSFNLKTKKTVIRSWKMASQWF